VVLPAVGLDEDALGREDEVGFEQLDVVVDPRRLRETGVSAEGEEALLELGLREGGAGGVVVEGFEELACSAVAGPGSCQGIEGKRVAQTRVLRAVEEALDAAPVESGGEVEDRAARRRNGDAVFHGGLSVEGARAVDANPLLAAPSPRAGDGHVDDARVALAQAPECTGGGMTEDRGVATGEDSGHPPAALDDDRVADRVHALMSPMQRSTPDPRGDAAIGEAKRAELVPRDDAVLPRCQSSDRLVERG
jgi:hypothetical protein